MNPDRATWTIGRQKALQAELKAMKAELAELPPAPILVGEKIIREWRQAVEGELQARAALAAHQRSVELAEQKYLDAEAAVRGFPIQSASLIQSVTAPPVGRPCPWMEMFSA